MDILSTSCPVKLKGENTEMPGLNVFIRLTVLIAIFCLWMAPAVLSACPYRSGIPLATTTLNPIPIGAATDHSITGKPLLAMGDAPVPDGHEDKPRSTVTGIGGKGVAPHSKKWKNGQVSVAIDIGHSPQSNGARSARNRPEYDYNLKMATAVLGELNRSKRLRGFFINPSGEDITLARRAALIKEAAPGILVSIHHDSV
ncbi:MAG: N-acetylmuramoyl-L-alanine amidase, partial [Syntrophobacteraceae bacterium]